MKDSRIISLFVGFCAALMALVLAAIFMLPTLGAGQYLETLLVFHPTLIAFAAFPLVTMYLKATDAPMPYGRALKLACLALAALIPLSVVSESLNANALVSILRVSGLIEEGQGSYIVFSYRGFAMTVFGTLVGLGFVFPAQVKLGQKKKLG